MSKLLPVEEAQVRLIALAAPLTSETVAITEAHGRYLAEDLVARRGQPAADMSAMDGYAIRFEDRAGPWKLVGECKAGSPPCPAISSGETARIFTGALMPEGADTVVIQENVAVDGEQVRLTSEPSPQKGHHVRHKGGDFKNGDVVLGAGSILNAAAIGLTVIAGYGTVPVGKRPKIAILSTGDELVEAGSPTAAHQIPASNDVMLSSMLQPLPCESRNISRIPDDMDAICAALKDAQDSDIIVTIGGASVGDHDLIGPAFEKLGGRIDFWKIAMKPGKPLMAGKLGHSLVIALPGNPASAFVTAILFLLPAVRYLAGASQYLPQYQSASVASDLPAVQKRALFLRAKLTADGLKPFDSQDSAKLSVLAESNALLYRPALSPAVSEDSDVPYIPL